MEDNGHNPNRPKTFARNHTIPQEVTTVSIYAKGPAHPEGCPGPVGWLRAAATLEGEGERQLILLRLGEVERLCHAAEGSRVLGVGIGHPVDDLPAVEP